MHQRIKFIFVLAFIFLIASWIVDSMMHQSYISGNYCRSLGSVMDLLMSVWGILFGSLLLLFPKATVQAALSFMPAFIARRINIDACASWGILRMWGVLWLVGGFLGAFYATKSLVTLPYP